MRPTLYFLAVIRAPVMDSAAKNGIPFTPNCQNETAQKSAPERPLQANRRGSEARTVSGFWRARAASHSNGLTDGLAGTTDFSITFVSALASLLRPSRNMRPAAGRSAPFPL